MLLICNTTGPSNESVSTVLIVVPKEGSKYTLFRKSVLRSSSYALLKEQVESLPNVSTRNFSLTRKPKLLNSGKTWSNGFDVFCIGTQDGVE